MNKTYCVAEFFLRKVLLLRMRHLLLQLLYMYFLSGVHLTFKKSPPVENFDKIAFNNN